ncbi:hypothetical protein Trydic_g4051 [Trypoxylus dichotomus]
MESKKGATKKAINVQEVVDRLHEKHLEEIRKENMKARNRKRKLSETSLDEIIKKVADEAACEHNMPEPPHNEKPMSDYLKWKQTEYDTYNSVNRQNVLRSIDVLEKALNKKNENGQSHYCSSSDSVKSTEVLWSTSTFLIRYIKTCILNHNWKPVPQLLHYMLSHKKLYYGYIKEKNISPDTNFCNRLYSLAKTLDKRRNIEPSNRGSRTPRRQYTPFVYCYLHYGARRTTATASKDPSTSSRRRSEDRNPEEASARSNPSGGMSQTRAAGAC